MIDAREDEPSNGKTSFGKTRQYFEVQFTFKALICIDDILNCFKEAMFLVLSIVRIIEN